MTSQQLVTIGLPIFNGERTVEQVVRSAMAQDHQNLEIVIADNASTDDTETICRDLAASDDRIVYVRRPENVGLVPNFLDTLAMARGVWFRWIGDGDLIEPTYVSRCLAVAEADERVVLVSTQIAYGLADGTSTSTVYQRAELASPDPAVRFAEMLRLLTSGYAELDPLYSLLRRDPIGRLPFPRILRGDEVYAARMALAGPWGHIPEVLARRGWAHDRLPAIAPRLGVPRWHAPIAAEVQCLELWRSVRAAGLAPEQMTHARSAIARLYVTRILRAAQRARAKFTSTMLPTSRTYADRSNGTSRTSIRSR